MVLGAISMVSTAVKLFSAKQLRFQPSLAPKLGLEWRLDNPGFGKNHTVQRHGKESLIVTHPFSITNRSSIPIGLLRLGSEDQYCERVDQYPIVRELEAGWIRYG